MKLKSIFFWGFMMISPSSREYSQSRGSFWEFMHTKWNTPPKTKMTSTLLYVSVGNISSNHWFSGDMLTCWFCGGVFFRKRLPPAWGNAFDSRHLSAVDSVDSTCQMALVLWKDDMIDLEPVNVLNFLGLQPSKTRSPIKGSFRFQVYDESAEHPRKSGFHH